MILHFKASAIQEATTRSRTLSDLFKQMFKMITSASFNSGWSSFYWIFTGRLLDMYWIITDYLLNIYWIFTDMWGATGRHFVVPGGSLSPAINLQSKAQFISDTFCLKNVFLCTCVTLFTIYFLYLLIKVSFITLLPLWPSLIMIPVLTQKSSLTLSNKQTVKNIMDPICL